MRVTRCVLATVAPVPPARLACGGETAPSDDAPTRGTTATGSSAMNTPASPSATQPQDSSGTSLDEYLAGHGDGGCGRPKASSPPSAPGATTAERGRPK